MGDIADYHIDRMLDRHLSFGSGNARSRSRKDQIEAYIRNLSDKELLFAAQTSIREKTGNEKFREISEKIISSTPASLSEKQRNCFLGLIDWQDIEVRKFVKQKELEELADIDLINVAKECIEKEMFNEKFLPISTKVLEKNPESLSEKERNCLYGLASNYFILQ